jgi:2,3-bisphosphoglycerate-dependent phosphoglycerate mutase
MKNIYLIIAANNLNNAFIMQNNNEPEQVSIEKEILSITGEEQAQKLANNSLLNDIDAIYSSNHVSAMAASKYLAYKYNLKININMAFNERKVGIISDDKLKFIYKQTHNFDYKERNGESLNDVKKRMSTALKEVLKANNNAVIYTHPYALLALLTNWCELGFNYEDEAILTYEDEVILDSTDSNLQVFKLVFNDLNLIKITKLVTD